MSWIKVFQKHGRNLLFQILFFGAVKLATFRPTALAVGLLGPSVSPVVLLATRVVVGTVWRMLTIAICVIVGVMWYKIEGKFWEFRRTRSSTEVSA